MKATKFVEYRYACDTVRDFIEVHANKIYTMTGIEARRYIAKELPCVSKQIIDECYTSWRECVMNNPINFKSDYKERVQIHTNMDRDLKLHLIKCQEMNGFVNLNQYILHLLKEGSNYEG